MRSFFRLSFSQRSSFDEIIPKEEIFPSYYNEQKCACLFSSHAECAEIYSSSSCARFTPRDRSKVEVWTVRVMRVQVNKEYVR